MLEQLQNKMQKLSGDHPWKQAFLPRLPLWREWIQGDRNEDRPVEPFFQRFIQQ